MDMPHEKDEPHHGNNLFIRVAETAETQIIESQVYMKISMVYNRALYSSQSIQLYYTEKL
jgi:hypothetical protein